MYEQVPIQRTVYGPGENLLILGSVVGFIIFSTVLPLLDSMTAFM